jgi:hypothetical protein
MKFDIFLEQKLLGELDPKFENRIDESRSEALLQELEADNHRILTALPPEVFAARIEKGRRQAASRNPAFLRALIAVPAAAMLVFGTVFFLSRWNFNPGSLSGLEQTNLKGQGTKAKNSPELVIHKKTDTGISVLENHGKANEGDFLQLEYFAAGRPFGAILSVDGRGVVTVHLSEGPASAKLSGDAGQLLPFSYKLDDAPEYEIFYFVCSDKSFSVDELKTILQEKQLKASILDLPSLTGLGKSAVQTAVIIEKR